MQAWCEERGLTFTLVDRSDASFVPVPWNEMPQYLSQFDYFLDFKGQTQEHFALSKTALEALACGCTVVHDSDLEETLSDYRLISAKDYFDFYSGLERASLWGAVRRLPRLFATLFKWLFGRLD